VHIISARRSVHTAEIARQFIDMKRHIDEFTLHLCFAKRQAGLTTRSVTVVTCCPFDMTGCHTGVNAHPTGVTRNIAGMTLHPTSTTRQINKTKRAIDDITRHIVKMTRFPHHTQLLAACRGYDDAGLKMTGVGRASI